MKKTYKLHYFCCGSHLSSEETFSSKAKAIKYGREILRKILSYLEGGFFMVIDENNKTVYSQNVISRVHGFEYKPCLIP